METTAEGRQRFAQEAADYIAANPEQAQRFADWIGQIDFQEIKDIFLEYARKSGVEEHIVNFLGPEDIYPGSSREGAMFKYFPHLNLIQVYPDAVLQSAHYCGLSPQEAKIVLIHGLIHEYVHVTGKVKLRKIDTDGGFDMDTQQAYDMHRAQVRRQEDGRVVIDQQEYFRMLNEGVTERIADEVADEYLTRLSASAMTNTEAKAALHKLFVARFNGPTEYGEAHMFIQALVRAIAEGTDVPEDVVWRGFVHHYFRGDFLRRSEIFGLLDEIVGVDFTSTLALGHTPNELFALKTQYPKLSLSSEEAAQKWLDHLQITRGAS